MVFYSCVNIFTVHIILDKAMATCQGGARLSREGHAFHGFGAVLLGEKRLGLSLGMITAEFW